MMFNFTEATEHNAKALLECVKNLTQKAKAAGHPEVVFDKVLLSDGLNAGCSSITGKNILIVGKELMESMGHTVHDAAIPEKLEAVLAHELGHARFGDGRITGGVIQAKLAPLTFSIAAIAGTAFAKNLYEKHQDNKEAQAKEIDALHAEAKKTNGSWKTVLTVCAFVAAAILGLRAGQQVSKLIHHGMEHRADNFAAEVMGTGEHLADALSVLQTKQQEMLKHLPKWMRENAEKVIKLARTHPNIEERITNMRNWTR